MLQIVEELPVDEWGRLEEGFDVESHLAGRTFHTRLDDGSWVALDGTRFARFAEALLEVHGLLEFHRADTGRLFEPAEALEGCGAPWTGGREILDLGARLRALAKAPELAPPATLRGELRPYQRTGAQGGPGGRGVRRHGPGAAGADGRGCLRASWCKMTLIADRSWREIVHVEGI